MNERERYLATLLFQTPDRIPFAPGGGRKSTRQAWHKQGLPESVDDYVRYAAEQIGVALPPPVEQVSIGVDFRMIPQFEEKVIEDLGDTWIVQDWKGNVCEISKEFDTSYLRDAIDFVTRRWVKCPVESRADWEDMKRRYVVDAPSRFPDDLAERAKKLKNRTYPSGLVFHGPFWQLREWLGFENLCMLFLDDPDLTQEMVDFWEDFVVRLVERIYDHYVPDYILICEDMAFKEKPMIGPDMCRQFLLKCWRRWGELSKQAGVPIYEVDSDGHAGHLIPVWIEAGLNVNSPQEVAAGNDLPAYRRQFGTQMAYRGGIDKRKMAKGGDALRAEFERLRPAVQAGGYIPGCDHGIPPDVSWPHFVETCRLLAEVTGWL
ncbi:MAG: hypothetical protein JXQ73_30305 [Phycisphaerae bacterium]|nr:hypothetical protein [Phycisphaerae bacterium]